MPGTYPPAPPTLSGDLLTISRFLQSPTAIRRRLRTIADLRFVADQLLTGRYRSSGGAVLYEVSEPITNTRAVTAVSPGSEYPRDTPASGTAALAAVSKWGEAVRVTDEQLKRSVYMGQEIDRSLRKLLNTVIQKIDQMTIAAIAASVTQTQAVTASWDDSSATILRDIEYGKAVIKGLNMGYKPDTILMSDTRYAEFISDEKIATLRKRESSDNPVYTGEIEVVAGLKIVSTETANLPTEDVWVLDSTQLGGMADETDVDPGYTVSEMGIQVQTKRIPEVDAWDMWARRITVPIVQETGAAIRLTGTAGS
jgi:hypothetical protein